MPVRDSVTPISMPSYARWPLCREQLVFHELPIEAKYSEWEFPCEKDVGVDTRDPPRQPDPGYTLPRVSVRSPQVYPIPETSNQQGLVNKYACICITSRRTCCISADMQCRDLSSETCRGDIATLPGRPARQSSYQNCDTMLDRSWTFHNIQAPIPEF